MGPEIHAKADGVNTGALDYEVCARLFGQLPRRWEKIEVSNDENTKFGMQSKLLP